MARPRRQDGWLRVERGSWLGTWRVHGKDGKSGRRSATLGRECDLTEAQARKRLRDLIDKDTSQFEAVSFLGRSAKGPRRAGRFLIRPTHHSGTKGKMSELAVTFDLLARGLEVFVAASPTSACDLMVCDVNGDHRLRIEVKTAEIRKTRTPFVRVSRNLGKFDILAIVHADGTIEYRTHNGIDTPRIFLNDSDLQLTSEARNETADNDLAPGGIQ